MTFDFIKIAVRHSILIQELSVHLFDGKIKTIVVSTVLIGSGRTFIINNIKLEVMRFAGFNATQFE